MTDDIYQKLAEHLDTLPQRFPTNTGTGLELKVLRHIFSPEEAEMAIQLQPMPELPADIAHFEGGDLPSILSNNVRIPDGTELTDSSNGATTYYVRAVDVECPEHAGGMFGYLERFTPEVMGDARRAMNAAIKACQTDIEKQRVEMVNQSLKEFELFMKTSMVSCGLEQRVMV